MRRIVRVVEDKTLEFGKLAFYFIEPRSVRRRPDKDDVVFSCPPSDFDTPMGREVV